MTVGEKIKQRRIELNMSQDELAKKCGYKSRSSINKIELSRDLPLKKVKLMASALDLSVSYLMDWDAIVINENISDDIDGILPTEEALNIASAFDRADDTTKEIVRLSLQKYFES